MGSDPRSVLGVSEYATEEEIREAYREKVKEIHPDVGGDADRFMELKDAYHMLIENDEESTEVNSDVFPASVEYVHFSYVERSEKSIEELFSDINDNDSDSGRITVNKGESVLEAAERSGMNWPFSCRGGACANCAVKIIEGEVSTPEYHILSPSLLEEGFRLSCIGEPLTKNVKLIVGVKDKEKLSELLLPNR